MHLILRPDDLPPLDTSAEIPSLDFKATVDPTDSAEMAKDVAALANTSGGAVLIGAVADGQRLVRYAGISEALAKELERGYEVATKDLCRPTPYLETHRITHPNGPLVLAVNVLMSPVAPVGFRDPKAAGKRAEGWCFPRRIGSHTQYLQPDQFGVFASMTARRSTALLLAIPEDEKGHIRLRYSRHHQVAGQQPHQHGARFESLSLERNYARFLVGDARGENLRTLFVPLDWIATVWRDDLHNEWQVVLNAILVDETRSWVAYPLIP